MQLGPPLDWLTLAALPAPLAAAAGVEGLLEPLRSPQHLLVMMAVGLLAARQEVRVRVALPLAFLLSMGAGLALSAMGLRIPLVAPVLVASVLVVGALLALRAPPPAEGAAVLAALFGLVHGAVRDPALQAVLLPFAAGTLATTAALLALGAGLGLAVTRLLRDEAGVLALRLLGANLGLAGLALAFSFV